MKETQSSSDIKMTAQEVAELQNNLNMIEESIIDYRYDTNEKVRDKSYRQALAIINEMRIKLLEKGGNNETTR